MSLCRKVLATRPTCRIIDVGGTPDYWRGLAPVWKGHDLDITIVNVGGDDQTTDGFKVVQGDARSLRGFADNSFDIVHSNSVIEHVGTWSDQVRMAGEVARLAPAYHVQTPNYWFPFEMHLRLPLIHWLPHPVQRAIVMAGGWGFYERAETVAAAEATLADARLLDHGAMRALFPDAVIKRERMGPLTKSLIAVREG